MQTHLLLLLFSFFFARARATRVHVFPPLASEAEKNMFSLPSIIAV